MSTWDRWTWAKGVGTIVGTLRPNQTHKIVIEDRWTGNVVTSIDWGGMVVLDPFGKRKFSSLDAAKRAAVQQHDRTG